METGKPAMLRCQRIITKRFFKARVGRPEVRPLHKIAFGQDSDWNWTSSGILDRRVSWKWIASVVGMTGLMGYTLTHRSRTLDKEAPSPGSASATTVTATASADQDSLPAYAWDEIERHKTEADGIWVTHGENVYDVTDFVQGHPGGDKLLLAAGGPIEPFWDIYTIHKTTEIKEMLNSMKIGRVKKSDGDTFRRRVLPKPYADEPKRHPAMVINSMTPFDAESPPELLTDHFQTPNDVFYVRNHLPVPRVDLKDYKLNIEIPGSEHTTFTLKDLKEKFEKTKVVATLQCAGNRRADMGLHKKIYGANGGHTSISNAEWGGVLLKDVLLDLGLDEDNPDVKHIHFEGYDKDISGEPYGVSVPVEIAMKSGGDVLLAYEMNGEELPLDHGFPLRVVIPGVVGARSVKWLKSIKACKAESSSFFHKKDYRITPPSADWSTFDFQSEEAHAIYCSPVQSAICTPCDGSTVDVTNDVITVRGYAFSGGGNGILRVDVSADGGKTWHSGQLLPGIKQPYQKNWAWRLWEATVPMPRNQDSAEEVQIWCKATDTFHNVQPENVSGIWNLRGFLNNSWHKITLKVENE